jgi:hypothetical protein
MIEKERCHRQTRDIPAALLHSPRGVPGIKRKDKERKGGERSTATVSETEEFNHGLAPFVAI